ncbi:hypothetical protein PISL3812_02857 [Talaromyces islandicus]|uniref:BAG domain-containing protein n=1 Tax=Talaromyces islandicus TaxID=28573 RepID=A0A0U1LRF1_TALIS|nr:hypothetical protein PISL3812_02857 [Talaromyces islandicus]
MTLRSFSLPPVSLSSLTEAPVVSYSQELVRRLSSLPILSNNNTNDKIDLSTASLAALLLSLVAVVVTMSWRDQFAFWRRNNPQVRDSDFSYLTGADDDGNDNSHRSHHHHHHHHPQAQYIERRPRAQANNNSDEDTPDILLLKHRGVTYPLHFPAYAIDDGDLTVGDIRRRAAEKTAATDLQRIKILYKGKLLRDDDVACKDEGLKQQSEIMCIVSDVRPGESTSDLSESGGEKSDAALSTSGQGQQQQRPSKNKRANDKKKQKKKKKRDEAAAAATATASSDLSSSVADNGGLAPPSFDQHRPTSSSGRSTTSSAAPSPAPSLQNIRTGNAQVDALLHYLRGELAPMCEAYITDTPTDAKAREYEHKRLSETILAQVILKADGIDSEEARTARRALIKEAQSWLTRIDEVDRNGS